MVVEWSSLAIEQFAEILSYVEDNYGLSVAKKTKNAVLTKVDSLSRHPQSGNFDSKYSDRKKGYEVRHVTLYPNVVYYLLVEDKIIISAIVHSKQSPDTIRNVILRFLTKYRG